VPVLVGSTMFACVYLLRPADGARAALTRLAQEFSPRYELRRADLVAIDVRGLERLLGAPSVIGAELARDAGERGLGVHVALAPAYTAATVLALARSGVTVVDAATQAAALAPLPIGILERIGDCENVERGDRRDRSEPDPKGNSAISAVSALKHWGVQTLGELAALPTADLAARLGRGAVAWQAVARGDDTRPLVPALPEERFDGTLELDWPIEGLEPLSFVLTRLLEPLSTRLERRDRGAAVLHIILRLGPPAARGGTYTRRLELPTPMRDVRTLRTLALLDLESHPPPAPIECVTVAIDPTPGRVLQHTLFTRAHPTPEQLSTLLARLGALMGQDRIGAAATVDSYRPGAFAMQPFSVKHEDDQRRDHRDRREHFVQIPAGSASSAFNMVSALRRCRQPVPARVVAEHDRPVRVTTDRRGYAGGSVLHAAGPWRTSGAWWAGGAGREDTEQRLPPFRPVPPILPYWNRDEWDVSLSDGGVYRIFRDRDTDGWFIDGIFD
jgi:protein ImuB